MGISSAMSRQGEMDDVVLLDRPVVVRRLFARPKRDQRK
jgi:hypothetical protein